MPFLQRRVSVEFAHGVLGVATGTLDVERSCLVAKRLVERLRDEGHLVSTCVLIDDKPIDPHEDKQSLISAFLQGLADGPEVDFVCLETELVAYVDGLVSCVRTRSQRRVKRSIRRWLDEYGSLPCSVDIAIWHLLRLGLIADRGALVRPVGSAAQQPHPVDVAVSVLADNLSEYESKAAEDILELLSDFNPQRQIGTLYYPVSGSFEFTDAHINSVVENHLKEEMYENNFDHRHSLRRTP